MVHVLNSEFDLLYLYNIYIRQSSLISDEFAIVNSKLVLSRTIYTLDIVELIKSTSELMIKN